MTELLDEYRRFIGKRSEEQRKRCRSYDSANLRTLRRLAARGVTTYDELIEAIPTLPGNTKSFAAWLLGVQKIARAAPALLQLVLTNDEARGDAAVSLGRLEDRKSLRVIAKRALRELRRKHPSTELIESAVWGLKMSKGKLPFETLLAVYEREDLPDRIRGDAADALAWHMDGLDRRTTDYRRCVAAALTALQNESAEVRFWTMYLVAQMASARTHSGRRAKPGELRRALPTLRRIARTEHEIYSNLWPYSEEAKDAIYCIEHGEWPCPDAADRKGWGRGVSVNGKN